jgi:hypothetical protein
MTPLQHNSQYKKTAICTRFRSDCPAMIRLLRCSN